LFVHEVSSLNEVDESQVHIQKMDMHGISNAILLELLQLNLSINDMHLPSNDNAY